MSRLFPYANIVAGALVLLVGFGMHFCGQLLSVINWDFAPRLGLQEKGMPPHHKDYEQAIAFADVFLGWTRTRCARSGPPGTL